MTTRAQGTISVLEAFFDALNLFWNVYDKALTDNTFRWQTSLSRHAPFSRRGSHGNPCWSPDSAGILLRSKEWYVTDRDGHPIVRSSATFCGHPSAVISENVSVQHYVVVPYEERTHNWSNVPISVVDLYSSSDIESLELVLMTSSSRPDRRNTTGPFDRWIYGAADESMECMEIDRKLPSRLICFSLFGQGRPFTNTQMRNLSSSYGDRHHSAAKRICEFFRVDVLFCNYTRSFEAA